MSSIIPVVPLTGTIIGEPPIISGTISSDILSHKKYTGPYNVVPRKVEQTLATSDKLLTDDIEVDAINYSEVDNEAGGITINIGYE